MRQTFLVACALLSTLCWGQLTPERAYNGIHHPLPIRVRIPQNLKGDVAILLLEPVTAKVVGKTPVRNGRIDLARHFPEIWTSEHPTVLYAQLAVGSKRVGPAVVLQPMLNPPLSRLAEDKKTVEFVPDEDGSMYSGIRAYVDKDIVFDTSAGKMEFRLRPDCAPNTCWIISQLVEGGFYTDVIWHRIVAKRKDGTPFVIQGGDPTGTGSGGPGFAFPLEQSTLPHDFGVISVARSTDPNTNGSQIFVCLSREGTKHLDGKYAAFGEAVRGADAILQIAESPVDKSDRPYNPPRILSAHLVEAPPYGTGPKPVKRPLSKVAKPESS